jgi:HSP20 family protein
MSFGSDHETHETLEARMLLRYDPFRELDRFAERTRTAAPAIPMDAVRRGEQVYIAFDLPGVDPDSVDLEVERNVLTLRAERRFDQQEGDEVLAGERRQGRFSRQVFLGDTLDTSRVSADYHDGVLEVTIPMAEQAKARKVEIGASANGSEPAAIDVSS